MCKLLSVTNRHLCTEAFFNRIRSVAASGIDAIILREKDLSEAAYRDMAREVLAICRENGTICLLHSFPAVALELQADGLHLPLPLLRAMSPQERSRFPRLGASCHSLTDAAEAVALGCTYVTLGHIFATDCKPGLPPRGLDLLREVCAQTPLPVYAIGGISAENIAFIREAGAAGGCLMSGLMTCPDPREQVAHLRRQFR